MVDETEVAEITVTAPRKRRAPSPGVALYSPRISIILKKVISRAGAGGEVGVSDRYKEAEREIDLTDYLAEGSTVSVRRSVREPAGTFSLSLADKMVPGQQESLYGLIEPMDIIEIRAARDVAEYGGGELPILMRGFVGTITRSSSMTTAGMRRSVQIQGQDYGRILEIMRIYYQQNMVIGEYVLSSLRFAEKYGPGAQAEQPAKDFVSDVLDQVINKFIGELRDASAPAIDSPVQDIRSDLSVEEGTVSPPGINAWQGGTVYEMLTYFGDVGPWNELYVEDRDDGPYLVYRPTPFKTVDGEQVQVGAEAATVHIDDRDILALTESRSDDSVANWYWVAAPRYGLVADATLRLMSIAGMGDPDPNLSDYQNASPKLYGVRAMEVTTQQGARVDGQAKADLHEGSAAAVDLVRERRRILIENNKDNVVLEEGSMQLKGNERIKAGQFLRFKRGGGEALEGEYYAHGVTHEISPFGSAWTTSVDYDRGTGFINRIQRGSGVNSAYLGELNLRGVYGG